MFVYQLIYLYLEDVYSAKFISLQNNFRASNTKAIISIELLNLFGSKIKTNL